MLPNKYILTPPEDLYPLVNNTSNLQSDFYPDFDPWKHTKTEDKILVNFVCKGFYNSSKVNFESISARSSLHESLPKVANKLADQLSKVVKIREQKINKVSSISSKCPLNDSKFTILSGPSFTLPGRVTLTEQKRTLWLQELSSPHLLTSKLFKTIPHGLKRKQLLEQCYLRRIPIRTAIWLIKSCYSIEWKSMVMKLKSNQSADDIIFHLYKDWTDHMVSIMERLVFEMTRYSTDIIQMKQWKQSVSYYLTLLGNCYSINLLDKVVFHHWLVEFIDKVEKFEFLPLTLHILGIFWKGICCENYGSSSSDENFLINKIVKTLLHKYHLVLQSKSMINDNKYIINDIQRNLKVKESIIFKLKNFIAESFHTQSLGAFVMPNENWDIYKGYLYDILYVDKLIGTQLLDVKKKLELITYRNDSLKLTTLLQNSTHSDLQHDSIEDFSELYDTHLLQLKKVDAELINILDNSLPSDEWNTLVEQRFNRIDQVVQIILWAINPSRRTRYDSCYLVAKILSSKITCQDNFPEYSVEDIIWKLTFQLSKLDKKELNATIYLPKLYQLLNVFIGYGLIKVLTYIRKLISSGVLYLSNSKDKFFHCELLINLKISPLMKSQFNMVLKNVIECNSSYYDNYNYDQLNVIMTQCKEDMLNNNFVGIEKVPYSVKILTSEWYLNYICSPSNGVLEPVYKHTLIKNFKVFCIHLNQFHHFYKWIEFIVYHQLIADVESLESLFDILLSYENIFQLLINDHILFMKTVLQIFTKGLKKEDQLSYGLFKFNQFWKFFMKNFPFSLEMDTNLQIQLLEIYDLEKAKTERLNSSLDEANSLFIVINGISSSDKSNKLEVQNFPYTLQQNLKNILKVENRETKSVARKNLLLLMNYNINDYNKYMSICLKRKDYTENNIIELVSLKLLTLDMVQNILGDKVLTKILFLDGYEFGLYYRIHKDLFIKKRFKSILKKLENGSPDEYSQFLSLLLNYGLLSQLQTQAIEIICQKLKQTLNEYDFFLDLLNSTSLDKANEIDVISNPDIIEYYKKLDFSNLWLFQAFTRFYIGLLMFSRCNDNKIKDFIFKILHITKYNILCSKLFEKINNIDIISKILQIIEIDFFNSCSSDVPDNIPFLTVMVEIITNLSRKINKVNGIIQMSENSFELLRLTLNQFEKMDDHKLQNLKTKLNIFLRIFISHQKFSFQQIVNALQSTFDQQDKIDMIFDLCSLFEKTDFNLKLKLLLYDILTSLKSFIIYESTKKTDTSTSNLAIKMQIPKPLLSLPPFQISSFVKKHSGKYSNDLKKLGIIECENEDHYTDKLFIYNKKLHQFDCKLSVEPFQIMMNYQEDSPLNFNNTSLSMSLFDAKFDKKNPT